MTLTYNITYHITYHITYYHNIPPPVRCDLGVQDNDLRSINLTAANYLNLTSVCTTLNFTTTKFVVNHT